MPQKYHYKIFTVVILFTLCWQLKYLTNMYEASRFYFDVPYIEHLKSTPIEKGVKIIYKETPQGREGDRLDHRFYGTMTACVVYGGMYQ